jgi:hypothetical protein
MDNISVDVVLAIVEFCLGLGGIAQSGSILREEENVVIVRSTELSFIYRVAE